MCRMVYNFVYNVTMWNVLKITIMKLVGWPMA